MQISVEDTPVILDVVILHGEIWSYSSYSGALTVEFQPCHVGFVLSALVSIVSYPCEHIYVSLWSHLLS